MLRSFYTLRHGETDWNVAGRMQGHTDIPLNANGRAQAVAAAILLQGRGITRIVCSNLSRAHETAEIINRTLRVPLEVDERLKELGNGKIEGMTREDIQGHPARHEIFTEELSPYGHYRPVGGEAVGDVDKRVSSCIRDFQKRYPDDLFLFVYHGAVHRCVTRLLTGEGTGTRNAAPYRFILNGNKWAVQELLPA